MGCVYKQFENKASQQSDSFPDETEVQEFWTNIWGVSKQHNTSPEWLSSLRKKYYGFSEQGNITISEADVAGRVRRTVNWKAPGLDCVHVFG